MGGVSEIGNKAISASIEIEVELSLVEAELGNCLLVMFILIGST